MKLFLKKQLSVLLAVVLLLGILPLTGTSMVAEAADSSKVSDTSTVDGWKEVFPEESSQYAGSVWTDKSVFAQSATIDGVEYTLGDEGNFLVALSALASNKEIVGYSTIPTDTMLILDLSQSMDNSESIPDMVSSANSAMHKLLTLNNHNRVGVVLYSGSTKNGSSSANTATVLLPLDRYTPANSDSPSYLRYTGHSDETTLHVAKGLKDSSGNAVPDKSKETNGGTYIQNGLYQAYEAFPQGDDTIINTGDIQSGTQRMPVVVLMSDGAPTTGTSSYNNVGTSNMGDGSSTSNSIGFVNQLTAAWVKEKISEKYNGQSALFYTLGLGTSGNEVARSVLNPSNSSSEINTNWNNFMQLEAGDRLNIGSRRDPVYVSRDTGVLTERGMQYYVDRYFPADSRDDLNDAFDGIVKEIILQSKYYPTLVTTGDQDFDGYVSGYDEIGEFMEIKNMEILLHGERHSGETLTQMMSNGEFGDSNRLTERGQALLETGAERIGVDVTTLSFLFEEAWSHGQLAYNRDTGEFSNYVGYYISEDGEYLGFWDDKSDAASHPANAKYMVKDYFFYGDPHDDSLSGDNMMYVIIRVLKDIETQKQTIETRIPASMIPMVTYSVRVEGESLEEVTEGSMEYVGTTPIRILAEVGLQDNIHSANVAEVVGQSSDITQDANGRYQFYTNCWGEDGDIGVLDPENKHATFMQFNPSARNEQFYYTEDTFIRDQAGEPITGDVRPTAGYYVYRYFEGTGDSAQLKEITYQIRSAEILAQAQQDEEGRWFIPKGTAFQDLSVGETVKVPNNTTGTLDYSSYGKVVKTSVGDEDRFDVYTFLGNNGLLSMEPATGIKLTKAVDQVLPGVPTNDFEFTITLTSAAAPYTGTYSIRWERADGTIVQDATGLTTANGTVVLENVAAGDVVYVYDLPAGTAYTVVEAEHDYYTVGSSSNETGMLTKQVVTPVAFTNTPKTDGNLTIVKRVVHPFDTDPAGLTNKSFPIQVTLTAEDGTAYADAVTDNEGNTYTPVNGVITVTLKNGESVTLVDLPDGTDYFVDESAEQMPAGFSLDRTSTNLTGTIQTDATAVATVVNRYLPAPVAVDDDVSLTVTKQISEGNWDDSYVFRFRLDQFTGAAWQQIGTNIEITAANQSVNNAFGEAFSQVVFNKVGTYIFRIQEENDNKVPHLIYDGTPRIFRISVTDNDMDGSLEISSIVAGGAGISVSGNTVTAAFVNTYDNSAATDMVTIPIQKTLVNHTGTDISLTEFTFALYTDEACRNEIPGSAFSMDPSGEYTMSLTYGNNQLEDVVPENGVKSTELTYYLKEKSGSRSGMVYDPAVYKIVITLSDDGKGNFTAEHTLSKVGTAGTVETAAFENRYEPTAAKVTLNGTKSLTGRAMNAGEFTFELYAADERFAIPAGTEAVTTQNTANGSFAFPEISYTSIGTRYYVIKERDTGLGGVAYDTAEYYVTVAVTDNGQGALTPAVTVVKQGEGTVQTIAFSNSYQASAKGVTLSGNKVLSGRELAAGEFSFELYAADQDFTPGEKLDTAVNAANGQFAFKEITYDQAGVYYYTARELRGGQERVAYDETVYQVTVTVSDTLTGELVAQVAVAKDGAAVANNAITFTNVYTPAPDATSVQLHINKTLENLNGGSMGPENFVFILEDVDNNGRYETTSDKEGAAVFSFQYNEGDIGKTFHYKLYEKDTGIDGVEYDTKVYNLSVNVLLSDDNRILTTMTLNGAPVTGTEAVAAFNNTYEAPDSDSPTTGEHGNVLLWAVLMVVSGGILVATALYRRKKQAER